MTRVAFVGHSSALSGAELFLAGMLARSTTVDPVVVLFQDGPLRARLADAGIEVHLVPVPTALLDVPAAGGPTGQGPGTRPGTRLGSAGEVLGSLAALRSRLREIGPDLVYTNSAKAHVVGVPVARSLGLPVLMHVHNRIEADTYGTANRAALHAATSAATGVVVNSRATGASLRRRVGRRASLVYCPTHVGPRPADQVDRPHLELAVVGRIAEWKGQRLAVEALSDLVTRRGPGRFSLHLYGGALFPRDVVYRDEVAATAARLGVDGAVTWHGHVDDVPAAMARHDVVVHTSTIPEPLGQVVLEAMASGTPVVAADSGGPVELVEHGVSGLLYRTGDRAALVSALERLADEPALRTRLAARAWDEVHRYSYPVVVPQWEQVLAATAAGHRGPVT